MTLKISIFGLGYVGTVTAACLASLGFDVIGVDVNPDKVDALNNGYSPIIEPGLEKLIQAGRMKGNLKATQAVDMAVSHGDVLLICVGTPSDENGNLNFEYLKRVCLEIAGYLRNESQYKLIVIRSTMLPGTIKNILAPLFSRESGKLPGKDFGVAINPEFLREGCAIDDFMNPSFTLIGAESEQDGDILAELYGHIPSPIYRTDSDSACMVKYASNAFHGLKVTFANEIGQICKKVGIDGTEVMNIFCQDTRLNISSRYLRPGFAFGGSCLPKDLRALQYLARHNDLDVPVLEAILPSNQKQIQNIVQLIFNYGIKKVGIIGLTFKPDTDDLRESPMVELVEILSGKGVQIKIYDENVNLSKLVGKNKAYIDNAIPHIACLVSPSMAEVVECSEAVLLAHNIASVKEGLLKLLKPDQLLIDLVKIEMSAEQSHSRYEGVCW